MMKTTKEKTFLYRVLRPMRADGQVIGVGQLVELPRSVGAGLTVSGRVEPCDADLVDDAVPDPAFRPVAPGVVRR